MYFTLPNDKGRAWSSGDFPQLPQAVKVTEDDQFNVSILGSLCAFGFMVGAVFVMIALVVRDRPEDKGIYWPWVVATIFLLAGVVFYCLMLRQSRKFRAAKVILNTALQTGNAVQVDSDTYELLKATLYLQHRLYLGKLLNAGGAYATLMEEYVRDARTDQQTLAAAVVPTVKLERHKVLRERAEQVAEKMVQVYGIEHTA